MASNSVSYPLSRGYKASARLNLQHFLHAKDIGYLIHPAISTTSKNLRVADLGTGTGIWLVDLQNQLPNSVILDGFDISVFQFPPKEWLPANVRLDQLDVLGEIPQNLRGKYDIVNIRYFACVVKENNVDLVIRNALDMLKPGGHLQWSEQDYISQKVITANASISSEPFTALKNELEWQSKTKRERFSWISRLDELLRDHGLIDIHVARHVEQPQNYSLWQQTYMMVLEEMSYSISDGDTVRGLLQKTQHETPEGVFWCRGHLTFVGRKVDLPQDESPNGNLDLPQKTDANNQCDIQVETSLDGHLHKSQDVPVDDCFDLQRETDANDQFDLRMESTIDDHSAESEKGPLNGYHAKQEESLTNGFSVVPYERAAESSLVKSQEKLANSDLDQQTGISGDIHPKVFFVDDLCDVQEAIPTNSHISNAQGFLVKSSLKLTPDTVASGQLQEF